MEEIKKIDRKAMTKNKKIVNVVPKNGAEMIYSMSQHIGEHCTPLVKEGDRVLMGQKIGDSEKFISSPVHSSVSGVVKEIREVSNAQGKLCNAIIIENDGKYEKCPDIGKKTNYLTASKEEIVKVIRNAGIVGLGGAGFPTHVKLIPPADKPIDNILINGIECEPYLTNDHRLMLEKSDELIEGIQVLLAIHPTVKVTIAIALDKPDAILLLEEKTKNLENIVVVGLPVSLNQGAEKMLVRACLERRVPIKGLPSEVGVIVTNVATVIAIQDAVVNGMPQMQKLVTVSGDLVVNPQNLNVYIGMKTSDLIEECGGLTEKPFKMISGGPKMGTPFTDVNVPIIKPSSGILCFSQELAEAPLK